MLVSLSFLLSLVFFVFSYLLLVLGAVLLETLTSSMWFEINSFSVHFTPILDTPRHTSTPQRLNASVVAIWITTSDMQRTTSNADENDVIDYKDVEFTALWQSNLRGSLFMAMLTSCQYVCGVIGYRVDGELGRILGSITTASNQSEAIRSNSISLQ